MKIVQILPALNQGGVEYYVLENSKYISQYAENIVISSGGRLVTQLESEGSRHIELPIEKKNIRSLRQIRKLTALLKQIKPDIIHVHSRLQAWLLYFALRKLNYKPTVITTVHGFNSINRYSKQMLYADKVITVSEALQHCLENAYPDIPQSRYQVITQGIDPIIFNTTNTISPAVKEKLTALGVDLSIDKILLLPGRITRIKGIPYLIDLIKRFKHDGINHVKAVIVGDYNERNAEFFQEMKKKAFNENLANDVLWFGTCDDMNSIYQLANITLSLTTKPESYGRTVLESLACGTPVIGFDYGGVGENLQKFCPKGRIPPNDEFALYEAVLETLKQDKSQCSILPITDTIKNAQDELHDLYMASIQSDLLKM